METVNSFQSATTAHALRLLLLLYSFCFVFFYFVFCFLPVSSNHFIPLAAGRKGCRASDTPFLPKDSQEPDLPVCPSFSLTLPPSLSLTLSHSSTCQFILTLSATRGPVVLLECPSRRPFNNWFCAALLTRTTLQNGPRKHSANPRRPWLK